MRVQKSVLNFEILSEIGALREKHLIVAARDRKPRNGQTGESRFNGFESVAHFNDDEALFGQMICGFGENAANDVHAVCAGSQGEGRFMTVFARQPLHGIGGDIGRVRDNDVKAPSLKILKKIALNQFQRLFHVIVPAIDLGNLKRSLGNVRAGDLGIGKSPLRENG